ncbi:hypothetical protein PPERSA_02990 [Pseudocohnilembus persalinus]|uniref:Uncharacterized protein n=1 Tax=Pseudocohnilembus persalinus TaxID=266149 RepID=A0A0V0QEU0_PSEPJ|nr:hypothetical protein PPERSA_02990 [Pseudocohnilembus persalinus]|eukprot:KRX00730.1 hypothetical protein PPERSA_02990 [Pseudocohnilembus persalinus]
MDNIQYFYKSQSYGSNNIWTKYSNNSEDDSISYNKVVDSLNNEKYDVKKHEAIKCFRKAVEPQIQEYRQQRFQQQIVNCDYCNQVITNSNKIHVDHNREHKTFNEIVQEFMKNQKLSYEDFQFILKYNADMGQENCIVNEEVVKNFQKYHKENAQLRLLHDYENLSLK